MCRCESAKWNIQMRRFSSFDDFANEARLPTKTGESHSQNPNLYGDTPHSQESGSQTEEASPGRFQHVDGNLRRRLRDISHSTKSTRKTRGEEHRINHNKQTRA